MDEFNNAMEEVFENTVVEIEQLICQKYSHHFIKTPMRTSQLPGQSYVNEVLNGNPRRSYEVLRMPKDVFDNLCHWFTMHQLLKPSRKGVGHQRKKICVLMPAPKLMRPVHPDILVCVEFRLITSQLHPNPIRSCKLHHQIQFASTASYLHHNPPPQPQPASQELACVKSRPNPIPTPSDHVNCITKFSLRPNSIPTPSDHVNCDRPSEQTGGLVTPPPCICTQIYGLHGCYAEIWKVANPR